VDPKDKFEATLRARTDTWNVFMTRGRCNCIVKVEYSKKNKDMDDGFIPPNSFDKTFAELDIVSGASLVIIEMKNMPAVDNSDASEGYESEQEEMEEELDEGQLEDDAADDNLAPDGNQNSQKVDPESKILDVTGVN